MTIRTAVIGATGYSGAELVALLLGHPFVELAGVFASGRSKEGAGRPLDLASLFARFRGAEGLHVREADPKEIAALDPAAVFLATPHEVSHDVAPRLLEAGIVVLDLSGAFRLSRPELYRKHYGFDHARGDLLSAAVYGIPERHRKRIAEADLIAVPGCYPTSAILPLAPLVDAGVVSGRGPVIVDATSGVSGAGRAPALKTHFCEVSHQPYNVGAHRHEPEIAEHAGTDVIFTPHLGAFDRGILSTLHVPIARGVTEADARGILQAAYGAEPFVRLLPSNTWPAVADVRHTNFCDIAMAVDERRSHLIAASAIDNLVKGAAGQAVQCLNVRFGLPETAGLPGAVPCLTA